MRVTKKMQHWCGHYAEMERQFSVLTPVLIIHIVNVSAMIGMFDVI